MIDDVELYSNYTSLCKKILNICKFKVFRTVSTCIEIYFYSNI